MREVAYAELDGELGHRPREAMPRHVGLGTREQQHVATGLVAAERERDPFPVEHRVEAVAQLHDRAPGAVVDVDVVVELGDRGCRGVVLDRIGGGARGAAGVDPSGEHGDQGGIGELRDRDEPAQALVAAPAPDALSVAHPLQGTSSRRDCGR